MNKLRLGAAILSSKVLSTRGGNTEFCNTYAACDLLAEEEEAQLEGLRVRRSAWSSLLYYDPDRGRLPHRTKTAGEEPIA